MTILYNDEYIKLISEAKLRGAVKRLHEGSAQSDAVDAAIKDVEGYTVEDNDPRVLKDLMLATTGRYIDDSSLIDSKEFEKIKKDLHTRMKLARADQNQEVLKKIHKAYAKHFSNVKEYASGSNKSKLVENECESYHSDDGCKLKYRYAPSCMDDESRGIVRLEIYGLGNTKSDVNRQLKGFTSDTFGPKAQYEYATIPEGKQWTNVLIKDAKSHYKKLRNPDAKILKERQYSVSWNKYPEMRDDIIDAINVARMGGDVESGIASVTKRDDGGIVIKNEDGEVFMLELLQVK